MGQKDEIEYKLTQALAVWKTQGGPKSLKVSDATKLFQKNYPDITENAIRSIVKSSSLLDLTNDEIGLSKGLTDLM